MGVCILLGDYGIRKLAVILSWLSFGGEKGLCVYE